MAGAPPYVEQLAGGAGSVALCRQEVQAGSARPAACVQLGCHVQICRNGLNLEKRKNEEVN